MKIAQICFIILFIGSVLIGLAQTASPKRRRLGAKLERKLITMRAARNGQCYRKFGYKPLPTRPGWKGNPKYGTIKAEDRAKIDACIKGLNKPKAKKVEIKGRRRISIISDAKDKVVKFATKIKDSVIRAAWTIWKQKYAGMYFSNAEHSYRYKVFAKTYKLVAEHNKNKKYTYTLELNQFADLTDEEFAKRMLIMYPKKQKPSYHSSKFTSFQQKIPDYLIIKPFKYRKNKPNLTVPPTTLLTGSLDTVKDSKDWVKDGMVTEVRHQGCGECWTYGSVGAVESFYAQKGNKLTEFSKQQIIDCAKKGKDSETDSDATRAVGMYGCKGGDFGSAMQYIADRGVTTEATYETIGNENTECLLKDSDPVFKINGYRQVPPDDSDQLVAAINIRPVVVSIGAFKFRNYKEGIYNEYDCGCKDFNHIMIAVGYGNEDGHLFFKLKNTWGTDWGEDGYMRIDRKAGNVPGLCLVTQQPKYPY